MRTLTINEMSITECGKATLDGVITGVCDALTIGAIGYGIGILANWWNPVGWVDAAFLVGTAGCWIYSKF